LRLTPFVDRSGLSFLGPTGGQRILRKAKNCFDIAIETGPCFGWRQVYHEPPVRLVHVPRQRRILLHLRRALLAEILEVPEHQLRATTIWIMEKTLRTDPDPGEFPSYAVTFRFVTHTPDADHGIEVPRANLTHAVPVPGHAGFRVRIVAMGPYVNQGAHASSLNGLEKPAQP
jgi:hypothetical protein